MEINGKKVLVVGLARSGTAAARFLVERGARVVANDAKTEDRLASEVAELRAQGIEVVLGSHPIEIFTDVDLIVVSPGVPMAIEPLKRARESGIKVISEIELASWFLRGSIVGITGSNGKTTTTTLIWELLKGAGFAVQVGGNIGTPLISLVESSRDDGFVVAELSSFQLEGIERFRANVAVITNITPDHMDRYDSFESYAGAKRRILLNQRPEDLAVLNADDALTRKMAGDTQARTVFFSRRQELDDGIFLRGEQVISRSGGSEQVLLSLSDIQLRGAHNLENVMASLAVGLGCGAPAQQMRETVRNFKGVEHRLEWVAEIDGVNFYNDSKATNVDATIKALEAFEGGVILILGGKDKDSDYSLLAPLVSERVKQLVLIGAASDKIAAALREVKPITRCSSMSEAVRRSFELASGGDTVLLAPACASFDMFDNFEHRGRVFKEEVLKLHASRA